MAGRCRCFRTLLTIVALNAAFLALFINFIPHLSGTKTKQPDADELDLPLRRLEVAIMNSDEFAESVVTLKSPKSSLGISEADHQMITSILTSTRDMVDTARALIQDESTFDAGQEMMKQANSMFREVKEHIMKRNHEKIRKEEKTAQDGEDRKLLQPKKKSEREIRMVREDDERGLDVARKMYEMMVTFPECVDKFISDCIAMIKEELESLGLTHVEIVTTLKRNETQPGYNKVVIVTNELADRVAGRTGDGIVEYPFKWNDPEYGPISLGVDGKWNCLHRAPDECCVHIRESVPTADVNGKDLECHIFVPFGGIGNERRSDRIIVNLSPDGRVHEAPMIQ